MLDQSSPQLFAFVQAVREASDDQREGTAHVMCDWLQEQGATTEDVLELYAMPPATRATTPGPLASFQEQIIDRLVTQNFPGMPRPVISLVPPEEDDSLRPVLALWCGAVMGDKGLMERVKAQLKQYFNSPSWWQEAFVRGWAVGEVIKPGEFRCDCDAIYQDEQRASRELKRRVLRMFPDVRIRRSFSLDMTEYSRGALEAAEAVDAELYRRGWDVHADQQDYPRHESVLTDVMYDPPSRVVTCTQTLPPWLLIPPEPATLRDLDNRTVNGRSLEELEAAQGQAFRRGDMVHVDEHGRASR